MKNCIFHIPWAVNNEFLVPSEMRPLRIIKALETIGYQVDTVMGNARQRAEAIKLIKQNISDGKKYDFLYSESSTLPTILSEDHHYPLHPFLDFSFLSFCKKNQIPIGLFLRDIFWAIPKDFKRFSFFTEMVTTAFHKYDIYQYNRLLDTLFLPNTLMCKYTPGLRNSLRCESLPPGTDLFECSSSKNRKVFSYVGGISAKFRDIDSLFDVFSHLPDYQLIASFPEKEWMKCAIKYQGRLSPNITIVHYRLKELKKLFDPSGYALYFAHENSFSSFAMPYKLFEYISYETPIISNHNSAVGKFIEDNQIGYTFKSSKESLLNLLKSLPSLDDYEIKRQQIKVCKQNNTWEIRAKQIADCLIRNK